MKRLIRRVFLTGVLSLGALASVAWAEPPRYEGLRQEFREHREFRQREARQRRECLRHERAPRGHEWRQHSRSYP